MNSEKIAEYASVVQKAAVFSIRRVDGDRTAPTHKPTVMR